MSIPWIHRPSLLLFFLPSPLPCSHRRDSAWWIRCLQLWQVTLGYWEVTTEELKPGFTQGWEWTFYCHPIAILELFWWNMKHADSWKTHPLTFLIHSSCPQTCPCLNLGDVFRWVLWHTKEASSSASCSSPRRSKDFCGLGSMFRAFHIWKHHLNWIVCFFEKLIMTKRRRNIGATLLHAMNFRNESRRKEFQGYRLNDNGHDMTLATWSLRPIPSLVWTHSHSL